MTIQKISLLAKAELFLCRTPGRETFFCTGLFPFGSLFDPPEKSGMAHLLEHMFFQDNQSLGTREQIFARIDKLASDVNAATTYDTISLWLEGANLHWKENLRILVALFFEPKFNHFCKEKSIIAEEIRAELTADGLFTNSEDWLQYLLWGKQAIGYPIFGTLKSVGNIKKRELWDFYFSHIALKHFKIGVVGDVPLDELVEFCNSLLHPYQKRHAEELTPKKFAVDPLHKKEVYVPIDCSQMVIHHGFLLPFASKQEKMDVEILSCLLDSGFSSLLIRQIREKLGLVYDIATQIGFFGNQCLFSIRAETSPQKMGLYFRAMEDLFEHLQTKGFEDWELEILRQKKKLSFAAVQEDPKSALLFSLEEHLNPHFVTLELVQRLDQISNQHLIAMAKKILQPKNKRQIVLGPKKYLSGYTTKENLDCLRQFR